MKLFEPFSIKGMPLQNRIVLPALHLNLGIKSSRARAFYLERAQGGVGTIITSGTPVDLLAGDEALGRTGPAGSPNRCSHCFWRNQRAFRW